MHFSAVLAVVLERKGGSFSAFRLGLRTCIPEFYSILYHIGTGQGIRLVDCLAQRWWRYERGGYIVSEMDSCRSLHMVCSWWVVRKQVRVYGYVFSSLFCSVFHQAAVYVPIFRCANKCSTFSFPAFPEMDSGIRSPQTPKMHPKLSAPKVMRHGMYCTRIKFVDRRESVVANVSIDELLCEQRPAEKDSKGWEIKHGSVSHVLDLLAPVRLGCLLCKWQPLEWVWLHCSYQCAGAREDGEGAALGHHAHDW